MILTKYFVGDCENYADQVQWTQHGVHHDALRIIVKNCAGQAKLADMGLNDNWGEMWNPSDGFDDQTLQKAHDILAATWRSRQVSWVRRKRGLPPDSPLDIPLWDVEKPGIAYAWKRWLDSETKSWRQGGVGFSFPHSYEINPHLADLVVRILENQNTLVGDRAQAQLDWELVNRFKDVPWINFG